MSAIGLFGPSPSGQSALPLPSSELPLTLLGVATDAAGPARSACLVRCTYADETPSTRLLAIGERVCDVAEIVDILPESVVIRNLLTNRRELLTFPGTNAALSNKMSVTAGPGPSAPRVLVESPDLVTIEVRRDSMDYHLSHLPDLLNSALATPRYRGENGKLIVEGFKIDRIKEGSAIEQLGVRNGDVVLEANGEKLDSMVAIIRLLGQAQIAAQSRLIVLRNGQRITFVVNVK
jgi:type II secretory pathway component PulC